jgi:hypothetical protein
LPSCPLAFARLEQRFARLEQMFERLEQRFARLEQMFARLEQGLILSQKRKRVQKLLDKLKVFKKKIIILNILHLIDLK